MAVVDCFPWKAKGGLDEQHNRRWTVWHKVSTNSRSDGPMTAPIPSGSAQVFGPLHFRQRAGPRRLSP